MKLTISKEKETANCDAQNCGCEFDYEEERDEPTPEYVYKWKAVASFAVCAMGAAAMYATEGNTGIGWALLGLVVVWND